MFYSFNRPGLFLLRSFVLCFLMFNAWSSKAQALQQSPITGKVVDSDQLPLLGATVVVSGLQQGTSTNFDGVFSLLVKELPITLEVSYIGFETQQVEVTNTDSLLITMTPDEHILSEVVITALGMEREEKKLGYSQQTVSSESLTDARPNNWSDALRGKVAGLSITGLGGPISSQQIKLRGDTSLDPSNNSALIVIDGVPIQNEFSGSGASNAYMGGSANNDTPVDFGNAISDLNPDDIESITVLKGAGASALYGYQAANGAIIITTKSGKKNEGLGISISSSTKFDVITNWPDWQYEYGQGSGKGSYLKPAFDENGNPVPYNKRLYYSYHASDDGNSTAGSSSAFGPKFDGQYYYQYDPELEGQAAERTLWKPYKNNRKDFWRTGITNIQNISIQGGDANGSMRGSVTRVKNNWIMPNTGFDQMSVSVNGNYQIHDKIKVSSVINYRNKASDNLPGQGYNNHSIGYFMIFQNPNVDLNWYRPIWKKGQENISMISPYSSYIDNPYALAYEVTNSLGQDAVTGNFKVDVDLSDRLKLMLRSAVNLYNKDMEQRRPYDLNRFAKGHYRKTGVAKRETNLDFLLSYTDKLSDHFELGVNLGGNMLDYQYLRQDSWADGLEIPGIYNLVNASQYFTSKFDGYNKVNSLYGMVSMGWKNYLYLDLTARNDWNSMLPKKNRSHFFPSASLGFILSDLANLPSAINFAKLRGSIASVGGAGSFDNRYKTDKYYVRSDFGGSAQAPTALYNTDLKPEVTLSSEVGMDFRMFRNRLRLDAAVYQTNTKNQILSVPLPRSSGYTSRLTNAGEVRTRGIELLLDLKPIQNEVFEWQSTLNWSKSESRVLSLHDSSLEGRLELMSSSGARLMAIEGGSTGALYGRAYNRNEDGAIIYDNNGFPTLTEDIVYIGDTQPKWMAGIVNNFKYKNFTLGVVVDAKYGGTIYSHSHHKLTEQGKLKHTLKGREEGFLIGEGVVQNEDGSYSPNTKEVGIADYYARHYQLNNTEANSFDASFLKLREISLEYNFPKESIQDWNLTRLSLSLYGRNLATLSDFPMYDPEVAGLASGTNMHPGVEIGQLPVPAEFGINIKLGI